MLRPIPRRDLVTQRLRLRPSSVADAARAFAIRSDWSVARMLAMAEFPPDPDDVTAWFAGHEQEWIAGKAYRFAIRQDGRMIGLVDLDNVTANEAMLGYWLEQASWGQGLAHEAAQALVHFAFADLGLSHLKAGHAADNPASGRILTRLGFRHTDIVRRYSRPRQCEIEQWRYRLDRLAP